MINLILLLSNNDINKINNIIKKIDNIIDKFSIYLKKEINYIKIINNNKIIFYKIYDVIKNIIKFKYDNIIILFIYHFEIFFYKNKLKNINNIFFSYDNRNDIIDYFNNKIKKYVSKYNNIITVNINNYISNNRIIKKKFIHPDIYDFHLLVYPLIKIFYKVDTIKKYINYDKIILYEKKNNIYMENIILTDDNLNKIYYYFDKILKIIMKNI